MFIGKEKLKDTLYYEFVSNTPIWGPSLVVVARERVDGSPMKNGIPGG